MTIDGRTVYLKIDPEICEENLVETAGRAIREGKLVALPTETVYGLGANALDSRAVNEIFAAKGRPSDNPLIVHIAETDQVYRIADDVPVQAQRVMEAFWPGPLTMVLHKREEIPVEVSGGLDTVAIRMPDHPVARAIIKAAGVPVAAPSANTSGKPSPTTARHVLDDLEGKVDLVIDGGSCRVGLESTVLDMTSEPPLILRPGGITREQLEGVLGHVEIDPVLGQTKDVSVPKSPGMKYRHYSPEADVILVTGADYNGVRGKIANLVHKYQAEGKKTGILISDADSDSFGADEVFLAGNRNNMDMVARNLFHGLRYLDDKKVDIIIAEGYPEQGVGVAIMNRLKKAAGNQIIVV